MVGLVLSSKFTRPLGDDFEEKLLATHQGMAHFAGTGPQGAICKACEFFGGLAKGDLTRPATCQKFRSLTGKQGQKIPPSACACKYFERRA